MKKACYEKAIADRKRIKLQQMLFKMIKVAAYWQHKLVNSEGEPSEGINIMASQYELELKAAFTRWRNASILHRRQNPTLADRVAQRALSMH